jgi:ADP-heptose:LPS heptosyltransferase
MPVRPLIVRLRNWVGDVVLGIPALRLLQEQGFSLQLVGRRWAPSLLEGENWPVHVQPKSLRERVAQLRRLRREALAIDPGFDRRLNSLVLPFSFSSALEMRLAGLRAVGYAHEGRSLLLSRSVAMARSGHELERYLALARQVHTLAAAPTSPAAAPPARIAMRVSPAAAAAAAARLRGVGLGSDFIVLCPFAGGTFEGYDKRWPDFGELISRLYADPGWPLVACPGPGELEAADRELSGVTVLPDVGLAEYAALLQRSRLMISNDTGPGHLAAALDVPVLSVLGPTDPAQWRPWGPEVEVVRGGGVDLAWPAVEVVWARAKAVLAAGVRDKTPAVAMAARP